MFSRGFSSSIPDELDYNIHNVSLDNEITNVQTAINQTLLDFADKHCVPCGTTKPHSSRIAFATSTSVQRYLIILFMRFRYGSTCEERYFLAPTCNILMNGTSYRLERFICHDGTMNSGHYYSCVLVDSSWYRIKDAEVTSIGADFPVQDFGKAYLAMFCVVCETRATVGEEYIEPELESVPVADFDDDLVIHDDYDSVHDSVVVTSAVVANLVNAQTEPPSSDFSPQASVTLITMILILMKILTRVSIR
jgi:hypothetical protein